MARKESVQTLTNKFSRFFIYPRDHSVTLCLWEAWAAPVNRFNKLGEYSIFSFQGHGEAIVTKERPKGPLQNGEGLSNSAFMQLI
jgi:hypothetical protein